MEKSKSKKWIIVVSVLLLVAIGVTLLVLFLPKNTASVVEQTRRQSEEMFLAKTEGQKEFDDYKQIYASAPAPQRTFVTEIESAEALSKDLIAVTNFYSRYIVFARGDSTFQQYANSISGGFAAANAQQTKMESEIADVNRDLGNRDVTALTNSWERFKEHFSEYVKGYARAFEGLNKVFASSIPQGIVQNPLTLSVLNGVDAYLASIDGKVANYTIEKTVEAEDGGEPSTQTITIYAASKIDYFGKFILCLQSNAQDAQLNTYQYSTKLQTMQSNLEKFEETYGMTFKGYIDIVRSSSPQIDKVEADEGGKILAAVKEFLEGGVK